MKLIQLQNYKVALMLLAVAALLSSFVATAQSDDFLPQESHLFSNGIVNPSSPEASKMSAYGNIDGCDLYTGTVGMSIQVYTYSDTDFNIPVSLVYSSDGYKPNIQTGTMGLGWSLNAGGCIIREVRGIMDDAWPDLELYHFKSKSHGDQRLDNDPEVSVFGYAFLHDVSLIPGENIEGYSPYDYIDDYVLQGKAGSEYMPVYHYRYSHGVETKIEKEPDVFHFNIPGQSGSFILEPGGGYRFFDTSRPSGDYSLSLTLSRSGFSSFTITDGLNISYTFSQVDMCESWGTCGNRENVLSPGSWRLTRIEAPDRRFVSFEYGEENLSQTIMPVISRETNYRETWAEYYGPEGDSSEREYGEDINYMSYSLTDSDCLTKIRVNNAVGVPICTMDFHYSSKALESGCLTEASKKLDYIEVKNANGRVVRSCTLSYVMDNGRDSYNAQTRGVTFLHEVAIPGIGVYEMEYAGRNTTAFPSMGTWQTDWYGFWNHAVTTQTYIPSIVTASSGASTRPWLISMRQPSYADARIGMLEKLTWPTGGWTSFRYEPHTFTSDKTRMCSQSFGTTSGVRIAGTSEYDSDGTEIKRLDYSYVKTDGSSGSGRLIWRPEIYCQYEAHSTGFRTIRRKTVSSMDDFPYSGKSYIEYPRVLETSYDPSETSSRSIIEYLFVDTDCGNHDYYGTATGSVSVLPDWTYSLQSVESISNFISAFNSRQSTSLAGRLYEKTEYSDALSNPVCRTTYAYQEVGSGPSIDNERMILGYSACYHSSHYSPIVSSMRTRMYGNPDHSVLVNDNTQAYTYDSRNRVSSVETTGCHGDTLSTKFTYHDVVPEYLTSRSTWRGELQMSGEQFLYNRPSPSSHPLWYVPFQFRKAAIELIHLEDEGYEPMEETNASWYTVLTLSDYNAAGNPCTVKDALNHVTKYTWDSTLLNPASMTVYPNGATTSGLTTTWTWIPLVGLASETTPSGKSVSYTYDSAGRLLTTSNSSGVVTSRNWYNIPGDTINTTSLPSDINLTISKNYIASAEYRTTSDPAYVVNYYNGLGHESQTIQAKFSGEYDVVTPHSQDFLSRPIRKWLPFSYASNDGAWIANVVPEQVLFYEELFDENEYSYSELGKESCPSGRETIEWLPGSLYRNHPGILEYMPGLIDGLEVSGEKTVDGDGKMSIVWADREGRKVAEDRFLGDTLVRTSFRYDWRGNLTKVITPEGNEYSYQYDGRSRAIGKDIPGKAHIAMSYDDLDHLISSQDGNQRANSVTTTYSYNDIGQLVGKYAVKNGISRPMILTDYNPLTGLKTAETVYEVDSDGWVSRSNFLVRTFQYDSEERPVRVEEEDVYGNHSLTTTCSYDLAGNILTKGETRVKSTGTTTVITEDSYDNWNRKTGETISVNGILKSSVSYSHDELGRPVSTRYGNGSSAIVQTLGYTLQGWPSSISSNLLSISSQYESSQCPNWTGQVSSEVWRHGPVAQQKQAVFHYDSLGRLTGSEMIGAGNAWSEREIRYDLDGNLTSLDRYQSDASSPERQLRYSYSSNRRVGWGYDSNGNVSFDPVRNFEISYNLLNLPCVVCCGPGGDEYGEGEGIEEYCFWADGVLEGKCSSGDGYYDALYIGSLIYSGEPGEEELSGVQFADGFIDCKYGVSNSQTLYFLRDRLGSVRVVASDANNVISRTDYLPFGTRMTGNGLAVSSERSSWWGFSGKENEMFSALDSSTDGWNKDERYQHFGARTYDPFTCSFFQVDPMAEKYYCLSPYSYCAANPMNLIDENGETADTIVDVGFVLYDLGAAAVQKLRGNDASASSHLKDAGKDLVAALIPGYTAAITHALKAANLGEDVIRALNHAEYLAFGNKAESFGCKAFTKDNFRSNLMKLTGKTDVNGVQAHHVLPQKFIDEFKKLGIDINDPVFGAWWESQAHNKASHAYNEEWKKFFDENKNKTLTFEQVLNKVRELSSQFGFEIKF